MTRHKSWIWVILMALVLPAQADERAMGIEARVPEPIRAAEGFDPAESAGLFVGIRTFKDSRFAEVPFAVDDAVDLAHLFALDLALIAPQRVVVALAGKPVKAASVTRLQALLQAGAVQKAATQSEIYAQLAAQGTATGSRGPFVVTLATHSFNDQGNDFLVSTDSYGAASSARAWRCRKCLMTCRRTKRRAAWCCSMPAASASTTPGPPVGPIPSQR